jgi:acetyl esterase/lipase
MTRDLSAVHPELRAAAATFPRIILNRWTVRLLQMMTATVQLGRAEEGVEISKVYATGADGRRVMLRVARPQGLQAPAPALLWVHGGGLVIGSTKQDLAVITRFAKRLGIVVAAVEYRLAPGCPYPAAIDDCYTALKWVHANASSLGILPERIAVGGASAGGGLAASLAHMAHDRGEITLAYQLLIYPMLDDRSALLTDLPHQALLTWTAQHNRFGWESYLGQPVGQATVPPYAVPGRREDLSGLPPAWVGVGTLDLFYEEDVAYAESLKRHGVPCELIVVEGAFHGFDVFDTQTPVVQGFIELQMGALRRCLLES